jgi:hypothetical protein
MTDRPAASKSDEPERTALLGVLTVLAGTGTILLVLVRGRLLVPVWMIVAIAVPWAGFSIWLRIRRQGLGREGRYVDWWSIPHAVAGVLFALVQIEGVVVAAVAIGWELIEIGTRVREHPVNRAIDVGLAVAGWAATSIAFGGAVPFA